MKMLSQIQNHHAVIGMHRDAPCDYRGAGFYSLDDDGIYYPGIFATYSRIFIGGQGPYLTHRGEYGGTLEYCQREYRSQPQPHQL